MAVSGWPTAIEKELKITFEIDSNNRCRMICVPIPKEITLLEKFDGCHDCGDPTIQLNICMNPTESAEVFSSCNNCEIGE